MLNRTTSLNIVKTALGLGLIALLLSTVEIPALMASFSAIHLDYLLLMVLFPHIAVLLSTIKWRMLLTALSIQSPLPRLFNLYLIGIFFSNFLPTMVGGDAVRAYSLSRETGHSESVFAATFLERLLGLTALVCLLPLALFQTPMQAAIPMLNIAVIAIMLAYVFLLILIFTPLFSWFARFSPRNRLFNRCWQFLHQTHQRLRLFHHYRGKLIAAFLLSLGFYLLTTASVWAAAHSIGAPMDFFYLSAVVPLVLLAATLPISLNGLGLTEAGYVLFFQWVGISLEDALAIALLLRARLVCTGLIGGLLFLQHRATRRTADALHEEDKSPAANSGT